jgi:lipoyl(octanoyl) transferase
MERLLALEWRVAPGLVAYPDAVATMEDRVRRIRDEGADELVWLVEHPPLYTAGTSAAAGELLDPQRFPTFQTGRGGRWTYHGPGQRVAYVMLDLQRRGVDLRAYVTRLEGWAIAALAAFGVHGERREGRVGIWVSRNGMEEKIGAVGVRVRRWVTYHGIAINVSPDLTHFAGIVPCGIEEFGVTSLAKLGVRASLADLDQVLLRTFQAGFGAGTEPTTPGRLNAAEPATSSLA